MLAFLKVVLFIAFYPITVPCLVIWTGLKIMWAMVKMVPHIPKIAKEHIVFILMMLAALWLLVNVLHSISQMEFELSLNPIELASFTWNGLVMILGDLWDTFSRVPYQFISDWNDMFRPVQPDRVDVLMIYLFIMPGFCAVMSVLQSMSWWVDHGQCRIVFAMFVGGAIATILLMWQVAPMLAGILGTAGGGGGHAKPAAAHGGGGHAKKGGGGH